MAEVRRSVSSLEVPRSVFLSSPTAVTTESTLAALAVRISRLRARRPTTSSASRSRPRSPATSRPQDAAVGFHTLRSDIG